MRSYPSRRLGVCGECGGRRGDHLGPACAQRWAHGLEARAERAERFARAWKALAKRVRPNRERFAATYNDISMRAWIKECTTIIAWLRERGEHELADALNRQEHHKAQP